MIVESDDLGVLFIIPSSIEQNEKVSFLLDEQKKLLHNIKYFIVENEKIARKTIKEFGLKFDIQSVMLFKYNNKTKNNDLKEYFEPILNGSDMGLISDSGSPCIADPGSKIVEYAHLNNIQIKPLVGPSSIILSLMASGFNGQKFKFHGYIPIDKNDKELYIKKMMESIKEEQETQIFIETPYRNNKLLTDIMKIDNDSLKLCVATNLTDTNQTITSKTIKQWHQNKIPDLSKKLCIFLLN